MKSKKQILLMIIVVILLQILLPVLTIIVGSKFTIKSIAKEINTQTSEMKINLISELNTDTDIINSHEGETQNSNLEFNYRESNQLLQGEDLDYTTIPKEEVEGGIRQVADHMGYPRLKKLNEETRDGYKYILTFQNSVQNNESGIHIYYTRSKDLKTWDTPEILFEGMQERTEGSNEYRYFTSCDTLVLKDGTILAVASKWGLFYGDYGPGGLNDQGLYLRISKDNGNNWGEMKKIYTGYVWEPSIIELSTGEIQIYFTHLAHIVYVTGKASLHSTGTALISSLDGGNTWTPNVEGTDEEYSQEDEIERNPYSAYRISQQTIKGKTLKDPLAEIKEMIVTDALDFNKVTAFSETTPQGGLNAQGQKAEDGEFAYRITNQMPVAIELNNKNRIALVTESATGWLDSLEDITLSNSLNISISYSDKQEVKIEGESGEVETKEKYWLDLREESNDNIVYEKEEDVYDNEGLGIIEEGPVNSNFLMFTGLAPYIQQFPSGETIISYNTIDGNGEHPTFRIGDAEANFTNSTEFKYDKDLGTGFSSIELLSSHSIGLVTAATYTEGTETKSYIGVYPLYLNHTINAETIQDVSWTDSNIVWNDNTDALFIGSESQAQASIRVAYDNDNIYFLVDRLDISITDEDTIDLYINTDAENNNYYKVVLSTEGIREFKSHIADSEVYLDMANIKSKVYKNDTSDESGGYKVFVAIPKSELGQINDAININAVLNNKDEGLETIVTDTFTNVKSEDTSTWNKVRFTEKVIPTIDYDIKTSTNGNVNAKITFNKENVTITNNEGNATYTFTENRSFTFEYVDEVGKTGGAIAEVNWIDKKEPIINGINLNTKELAKSLTLTVDATDNESGIVGYSWDEGKTWTTSNEYIVNKNGIYKVLVKDAAENIATKNIEVTNIAYFKINTYKIKDSYIAGIEANTRLDKLIENIDTNLQYSITDKNGNVVANGSTLIATGMKIILQDGSSYAIVVKGELNSDGLMDVSDLGILVAHIVGSGKLQNEYLLAGDLNNDNVVDKSDLSIIARIITGKFNHITKI